MRHTAIRRNLRSSFHLLPFLVPVEGFEPTTYRFRDGHDNHFTTRANKLGPFCFEVEPIPNVFTAYAATAKATSLSFAFTFLCLPSRMIFTDPRRNPYAPIKIIYPNRGNRYKYGGGGGNRNRVRRTYFITVSNS